MANRLLTLARSLQHRKARERDGLFVAEGVRSVEELLGSPLTIRGALITAQLAESNRGGEVLERLRSAGVAIEEVSSREFESAAETDSPQGVLAIAAIPAHRLKDLPETDRLRLLVLDAVQDPGNVGTMVRTALAFGVTATFALPGTVDLWNAKVVRSGMGAHFRHPCIPGTWNELDAFRRDRSVEIWAADAAGARVEDLTPPPRLAIVVGNEGAGLSSPSRERADQLVALPIAADVESLNVAVAAGILLYELRR
jgi:RNA methyltransferase, TrmH family